MGPALNKNMILCVTVDCYVKCCRNAANFAQTGQLIVALRSWDRALLALLTPIIASWYRSCAFGSLSSHDSLSDSSSVLASSASTVNFCDLLYLVPLLARSRLVRRGCFLELELLRCSMAGLVGVTAAFPPAGSACLGLPMHMLSSDDDN